MPAEDGRLGTLLISFSSIGEQAHQKTMYVPVLANHPALRVVAVADEASAPEHQHALNRREAEALHLPYVADLETALADPAVDVVSVCCPLERRVAVLERVAAAGKHALVDKPLAASAADCQAIGRAFDQLVCMPAHHYRFQPALRSARAAVAGGTIGLPWAVHAEFVIASGTAAWPLGELLNFGLYPVDAIRAVLGLEARSVYATRGSYFYGGADDFAVLAMTFERGVIATTSVGRAPTRGHPNGYGGDRRMRIMGSHGTLVVDAAAPALSVYADGRAEHRYYGGHSVRALVDHFVAAVRGREAPEIGPEDARAVLEIIHAAALAADENRAVELNGGMLRT
ncbi:MAG: Gfo/Idh/MocA family oxidoreductase [Chloroflexota bacterium]|nr:Gfo/Idh/MocA family oxidoreductase [Chloroflexota bacterium]